MSTDQALADAPALVILGDPGAGKSTLLKVLALALARQAEGPLPILVPLNAYAAALEQGEISLHDFFPYDPTSHLLLVLSSRSLITLSKSG